ncbi:MAG: hypothetical protein IPP29_08575 [Bacteroidetes bacterium]|nr:hypothetical protein [Bacteroidota bacterium]
MVPYETYKIDFKTVVPNVYLDSIGMNIAGATHANITDTNGSLQFYSNGYYIANNANDTMINGTGINPSPYTTEQGNKTIGLNIPQANLILPMPDHPNLYYLFHNTVDNFPYNSLAHFMYYSVIDMSLNNGLGEVVQKNVVISTDTTNAGKISACKHGNGRDWWITWLGTGNNKIYKTQLTPYGVSAVTTQNIGTTRNMFNGQARFSPDGSKYSFAYMLHINDAIIDFYDFDRCTGIFSNPKLGINYQSNCIGGGVEFSANSKYAYVTNCDSLFQFDVTQPNIFATKTLIALYDSFVSYGFGTYFTFLERADDGKIYITTGNSTMHLHVINNPDSPGLACNFVQHQLQLPGYYSNSLPNHPNYFLGDNGLCNNLSYESLESWKVKKVTAFGNPTHDKFTLWFPPDKDVGVLEIYDVNGACIRTERVSQWSQYKTVDIGALSARVYNCKMRWPDGEGALRVVKLE